MASKTLIKSMQEYREELVLCAPEGIVMQFDQCLKNDEKIAAIKILREQGVVTENSRS